MDDVQEVTQETFDGEAQEVATPEVPAEGEEEVVAEQPDGVKLGADDRKAQINGEIQALIAERNEIRSKIASLEQQFQQSTQKAPEYIEMTPHVVQQVNQAIMQLEQQRVEAELEGDYLKAQNYRRQVDGILRDIEANEAKKEQALKYRTEQEQSQRVVQEINERAEFFRQVNNIPVEQWNQAEQWFQQTCQNNPIIGTKFREIADRQGPMAAVEFAAWYVNENMTKPAVVAKEQKEQAKAQAPVGGQQQNVGTMLNDIKTIKAQALNSGSSDDWASYFAAKRQLK